MVTGTTGTMRVWLLGLGCCVLWSSGSKRSGGGVEGLALSKWVSPSFWKRETYHLADEPDDAKREDNDLDLVKSESGEVEVGSVSTGDSHVVENYGHVLNYWTGSELHFVRLPIVDKSVVVDVVDKVDRVDDSGAVKEGGGGGGEVADYVTERVFGQMGLMPLAAMVDMGLKQLSPSWWRSGVAERWEAFMVPLVNEGKAIVTELKDFSRHGRHKHHHHHRHHLQHRRNQQMANVLKDADSHSSHHQPDRQTSSSEEGPHDDDNDDATNAVDDKLAAERLVLLLGDDCANSESRFERGKQIYDIIEGRPPFFGGVKPTMRLWLFSKAYDPWTWGDARGLADAQVVCGIAKYLDNSSFDELMKLYNSESDGRLARFFAAVEAKIGVSESLYLPEVVAPKNIAKMGADGSDCRNSGGVTCNDDDDDDDERSDSRGCRVPTSSFFASLERQLSPMQWKLEIPPTVTDRLASSSPAFAASIRQLGRKHEFKMVVLRAMGLRREAKLKDGEGDEQQLR